MRIRYYSILFIFFAGTFLSAQNASVSSGGNANGSGGTVSYSIGQVLYSANASSGGKVTQGVQQPYEIYVLSGLDEKDIELSVAVYPNPVTSVLNLKTSQQARNISIHLYDVKGKLLLDEKINNTDHSISMENFPPSAYFIKVYSGTKELKVFKLIKN